MYADPDPKRSSTPLRLPQCNLALSDNDSERVSTPRSIGEFYMSSLPPPATAAHSAAVSVNASLTGDLGVAEDVLVLAETSHNDANLASPSEYSTALVVEDDPKSAKLLRLLLEAEGFRVVVASSGEEALTLARGAQFNLITLDLQLPGMNGWKFLLKLRDDAHLASTPVVIIAGQTDLSMALRCGAAAVLEKPLQRCKLQDSLTLLGLRPNRSHPRCVLVVDDDGQTVELVRSFLERPTYRVESSASSAAAVSDALALIPDLIMINLMMNDLQGFRIVRALQSEGATAGIPILVVSSSEITEEEHNSIDFDPTQRVSTLNTPNFNRDTLLAEIKRALG